MGAFTPAETRADTGVFLRLNAVSKRFANVSANDQITLEFRRGQVHCLLGENGAGKSTLIGMLAGMQQPDAGTIEIGGELKRLTSPAAAIDAGIGVVYQHPALVRTMTVLENLMLAQRRGLRLNRSEAECRLTELGDRLGARFDPRATVGDLSLSEQQQLEIVRALWHTPDMLVLDEPTSLLSPAQTTALLDTLRELAAQGLAVLFVSHKLHEVLRLHGPVTVLRAGRVAARFDGSEIAEMGEDRATSEMLEAMFGEADAEAPGALLGGGVGSGAEPEPVLSLIQVSTVGGEGGLPLTDVSLQVNRGEVLGIAGIDGQGQRHLAEAIAGQRPLASGQIMLEGRDVTGERVRDRARSGVGYITDDRLREGIVQGMSVATNLVLKRLGERPFWVRGITRPRAIDDEAQREISEHDIRPADGAIAAGTLSGGNVQRLLIARELARDPRFIVFNKPTHGLDLRTVSNVRSLVRGFVNKGRAALLISNELDELTALSDRIAVLAGGRIIATIDNNGDRSRMAAKLAELIALDVAA